MRSSLGFHSAITTLFSSGVDEKRWKCKRSISTTYAASLKARSTSPYSHSPFHTRFVPASSWRMLWSVWACSASTTGLRGNLFAGDCAYNSRQRFGSGGVDADDTRVRIRRTHKAEIERFAKLDVVGELAPA